MSHDSADWIHVALPGEATAKENRGFAKLCTLLADSSFDTDLTFEHHFWINSARLGNLYDRPYLAAAAHTVIDLVEQGWTIRVDNQELLIRAPQTFEDRKAEKRRIRRQEQLRRDSQLRQPSVRRFIKGMERNRDHAGHLVSIFDLMRDGRELSASLEANSTAADTIKPYTQVVDGTSTCSLTGFKLHDIWRYFRHTWSNAYSTVPGRSMPILIRDAATQHHAVIGLAAISSPVVQIAERDIWIQWDTKQFVSHIQEEPTDEIALWLLRRIAIQRDEIYVDDLLRDSVVQPGDLKCPTPAVVARLEADAHRYRAKHHRGRPTREVETVDSDPWVQRAETHLFRSKRSTLLAETLGIQSLLGAHLEANPTAAGLRQAIVETKMRSQIGRLVRRARGERVGTVIADLTVCGAVAPYNSLAAGKLVGALAVSPPVLGAYKAKYSRPSEIASAMAGRPITREARLSFIGTTSLYGTGSSQYNRLFWPASVMGGSEEVRMGYHKLGRSRSFGTSHFSNETVDALVRLAELAGSTVRVNSVFGEGVSPRLRKVRLGLAALRWPANDLLKHGRERILYGVPLVKNLRDYSLGIDETPDYLLDSEPRDEGQSVATWWFARWGENRAVQELVLLDMSNHRLSRPVTHGARVRLPPEDELALDIDAGEVTSSSG